MGQDEPVFIEVLTTTANAEDAQRIATALINGRLAACAQIIGPVTSVYRWQGTVETALEYQIVAKCRASQFTQASNCIQSLHPYDLPQVVAVPIVAGSVNYIKWMAEETQASDS